MFTGKRFKAITFVCMMGVLLCAGCGKSETEKEIDRYLETIETGNEKERTIAVNAVKAMGDRGLSVLLEKIKDTDTQRYGVVYCLSLIGGQEAMDAILEVVNDEDSKLADMALKLLPENKTEKMIDAIIGAMEHYNKDVRFAACSLLKKDIHSEKVIHALGRALWDDDYHIRISARNSLKKSGSELALEKLVEAAEDPDNKSRSRMLKAVGEFDSPKSKDALKKFLDDQDRMLRFWAIYYLGKNKSEETLDLCAQMLEDKDKGIRSRTVMILGGFGSDKAVDLLVRVLENEKAGDVRATAIKTLVKTGSHRVPELLNRALKDPFHKVRQEVLIALAKKETPEAIAAYVRAFDDEHRDVRYQAYKGFNSFKSANAVNAAFRLLNHDEEYARNAAARKLRELPPAKIIGPLIRALENEEVPMVREEMVKTLVELKSPRIIDPLIKVINGTDNNRIRNVAVKGVAKFNIPKVVDLLIEIAGAEGPLQVSAVLALGNIRTAKAEDILIEALKIKNRRIPHAAIKALKQNGTERALRKLGKALLDDATRYRTTIIYEMKTFTSKRVFDVLFGALGVKREDILYLLFKTLDKMDSNRLAKGLCRLLADKRFPNRHHIANYMSRYRDEKLVVKTLAGVLNDENAAVRENAERSLRFISSPESRKILEEHRKRNKW